MKIYLKILTLILALSLLLGAFCGLSAYADEEAAVSVTGGGVTQVFSTHSEGWLYAIESGEAEIKLLSDWEGVGGNLLPQGFLHVPEGVSVTLDLCGHKIDRALTVATKNGCVIKNEGALVLTDSSEGGNGTITGGYTTGYGGGILSSGRLHILGGNIISNSALQGGAGVYSTGALYLLGGNISENITLGKGGGVCSTGGLLEIYGGSISQNCATGEGGGLYSSTPGAVVLGCELSHNLSYSRGGGIYFLGSAVLIDSQVKNNTSLLGGGIYCSAELSLFGEVCVTDNKSNCMSSNLYTESPLLLSGIYLGECASLSSSSVIGISTKILPTGEACVEFAKGSGLASCFSPDSDCYYVKQESDPSGTYLSLLQKNILSENLVENLAALIGDVEKVRGLSFIFSDALPEGYTAGEISFADAGRVFAAYKESNRGFEVVIYSDGLIFSPDSLCGAFYGLSGLCELVFENFNTESVTDMTDMLLGCSSLSHLDLSAFRIEKSCDTADMLAGGVNLLSVALPSEICCTVELPCVFGNPTLECSIVESSAAGMRLGRKFGISYLVGEDKITDSLPQCYYFGYALPLLEYERRGYDFLGWYLDGAKTDSVPAGTASELQLVGKLMLSTPKITSEPNDLSLSYCGEGLRLSVVAEHPLPLTYEWYLDGELIVGETDSSLLLSGEVSDSGDYLCKVSVSDGESSASRSSRRICVSILPATVTPPSADTASYVYTGEELTYNLAESRLYSIATNKAQSAGEYTVTVSLSDKNNYVWDGGEAADIYYSFVINKAVFDTSGISFSDRTVIVGEECSLSLSGELPPGLSVDFTELDTSIPGVYDVRATFNGDFSNYEQPCDLFATVTVKRKKLSASIGEKEVSVSSSCGIMPDASLSSELLTADGTTNLEELLTADESADLEELLRGRERLLAVYRLSLQGDTVSSPLYVELPLPEGIEDFRLVFVGEGGEVKELSYTTDGERVSFECSQLGDFLFVCKEQINPLSIILPAAALLLLLAASLPIIIYKSKFS